MFILDRFIGLTESLHIQSFGWPWPTFVSSLWHTFKEKSLKAHISETIAATATLPCTGIQLGIALGGRWYMWPWPSQKRSKRLDLLFGFSVPVRRWLDLERSYLAEGATAVFAFWPTLTYFCHSDTHVNNGLQPPSTYTEVVRLPTTVAFLVIRCTYNANEWLCCFFRHLRHRKSSESSYRLAAWRKVDHYHARKTSDCQTWNKPTKNCATGMNTRAIVQTCRELQNCCKCGFVG